MMVVNDWWSSVEIRINNMQECRSWLEVSNIDYPIFRDSWLINHITCYNMMVYNHQPDERRLMEENWHPKVWSRCFRAFPMMEAIPGGTETAPWLTQFPKAKSKPCRLIEVCLSTQHCHRNSDIWTTGFCELEISFLEVSAVVAEFKWALSITQGGFGSIWFHLVIPPLLRMSG